MSASDLVREWKAKAAQKAAERAAMSPPVPVCFDGFVGKAHRLDLMSWGRAGKMPQYLAEAMFDAMEGKNTEKHEQDLTPAERDEWLRFQCIAFCEMMDEPRFTTPEMRGRRETADDEIDYAEFVGMSPGVIKAGIQWQLNGCPDIPVQTEGGEVTISDLKKTRRSRKRAAASQSGVGMPNVWWKTKPTPRHIM